MNDEEEVEKNERKTEEAEKKREEIDSVVAILTRAVYNKSALYQMRLALEKLRKMPNASQNFEYQRCINDILQAFQMIERNTEAIIDEANDLCNKENLEEVYERIARYIIHQHLPIEQFFQSCVEIVGGPDILERPLVGRVKPLNSNDIFVSVKRMRAFEAAESSESGKMLVRIIISALKKKSNKRSKK